MAPARMKGVTIVAWFARAYVLSAPSIVASNVMGELALIRLTTKVLGLPVVASRKSSPNRIFVISTVSVARSGCVTDPMYGLSLYFIWVYTISKWRFLTGGARASRAGSP